jgi:hypothetical protein
LKPEAPSQKIGRIQRKGKEKEKTTRK